MKMNSNQRKKQNYTLIDASGKILFVGNLRQIRRRFSSIYPDIPLRVLGVFTNNKIIIEEVVEKKKSRTYTESMEKLKDKIKDLPTNPGVYLFKDSEGNVLYVGKAKNLKNRVGQYFGHDERAQIPFLVSEAVDVEVTVTESELESLFLENTLIKQYLPKYNIKLRDDKNYAFIQIDYNFQIPQITYTRKITKEKNSKFFGPFSSTLKIRRTLDFIRKIFPYCANKEIGKRPCFYYFLHRCPGVCVGKISLEEYRGNLDRIQLFLSGKTEKVQSELKREMKKASDEQKYELAGKLRDQYQALLLLQERQIVQFPKKVDWDFISVFKEGSNSCINLFKIREGKMIDKENFIYSDLSQGKMGAINVFLGNYYADATDLPREIYIEEKLLDLSVIEMINNRSGRKIPVSVPTRGKKLSLIKLGVVNAEQFLHKWEGSNAQNMDKLKLSLATLQEILKLPTLPRRIEGYDISNIQGTNPVGSMVVTKDGLPAKSEYRKFKINVKDTPDDFAMMSEMLGRRIGHLESEEYRAKNKEATPWEDPDLIVIDGGKGQLSAVLKVFKEHKVNIPVIGLAKRIEEIFLPDNSEPIVLSHDEPALQILQRLRDEAHRFAITFHRSRRSKEAVKSELDTISGIGPKTKKLLKNKFGTIKNIRTATLEEIASIVGRDKALKIKKSL